MSSIQYVSANFRKWEKMRPNKGPRKTRLSFIANFLIYKQDTLTHRPGDVATTENLHSTCATTDTPALKKDKWG